MFEISRVDCYYVNFMFSRSDDVDVMISPEDYSKAIGGLKELMSSVCDHCHDRCVKVMTARAKVRVINKWLDDLQFYILFKSILVRSGQ